MSKEATAFLRQFLNPLLALKFPAVGEYPGRESLNARIKTLFGFGGALNIGDETERIAKGLFLGLTKGAPRGAIHRRALLGQTLGKFVQISSGLFAAQNQPSPCN